MKRAKVVAILTLSLSGCASHQTPYESQPEPKSIGQGVAYLPGHQPAPEYPSVSKRLNEEGQVVLRVLVDQEGNVKSSTISRSSGFNRLDEAALKAVSTAKFKPYFENGKAILYYAVVPITFKLENKASLPVTAMNGNAFATDRNCGSEPVHYISSINLLPEQIQSLLGRFNSGTSGIADINEKFSATDALVGEALPFRHFLSADMGATCTIVRIEQGGRGYSKQTLFFRLNQDTWTKVP